MKSPCIAVTIFALMILGAVACEKNSGDVTGEVELYLLKEYETVNESPEIDMNSIVLEQAPLISYPWFRSYNAKEYYFNVTDDAREAIEELTHSVTGVAFAITADEEVVYTGYFVPAISSASVQWIIIDPLLWRLNNNMYVELGYPGPVEGAVIPDHRNDPRILDIFRRDGKLVE